MVSTPPYMIGCVRYIVYQYEIKYNSTVSSSERFSRSEVLINGPFSGLMYMKGSLV